MKSIEDILEATARVFGVSVYEITCGGRHAQTLKARQAVYLLCRDEGYSFPAIGAGMGKKHHTTVMHGVERAQDMLERGGEYGRRVDMVKEKLGLKAIPVFMRHPEGRVSV